MIYEQQTQQRVVDIINAEVTAQQEQPFLIADRATLLTPLETYSQIKLLDQELRNECRKSRPSLTLSHDKRSLVGFSLFLRDSPHEAWTQADIDFQLRLITSHPVEDVRYHAAEAIGSLLQATEPKNQLVIVSRLIQNLPKDAINYQIVEALFRGKITADSEHFATLPYVIRQALNIRSGNATSSSVIDFIKNNPQWTLDILQIASKHGTQEMWSSKELANLAKEIVEKMEDDSTLQENWKARVLLAVLNQYDYLETPAEELYKRAKTDPDEEVRIRMRRAFQARIKDEGEAEINRWVDTLLDDFVNLPEDKLRFMGHGLVEILPQVSPEKRKQVIEQLKDITRNNRSDYNRKTALKTLAKITDDSDRNEITNFMIGSLQDDSLIVQEEALLCLGKRLRGQLTAKQAKKILANLEIEGKDWFFKRIVADTMARLAENNYTWISDPTKPDILMFSGSFDPIHLGHVEVAKEAARTTGREVWIMPRVRLERRKRLTPIEYREKMIRKAIAELPDVYLLPRELSFRTDGSLIEESVEKLEVLAPYANKTGLVRGADVLSRANYLDPNNPRRRIFHVISTRGRTDIQELLKQLGLPWQVVTQSNTVTSTQIRNFLSHDDLREAMKFISPLQRQVLRLRNLYRSE